MSQWPLDRAGAERWFAVEFNNEAWTLVEAGAVPVDKAERLLHLAHAACLHWSQVGTAIHRQRALDLLAHAYAAGGMGEIALTYAELAWQLSLQNTEGQTTFDRAEAMSTMAVALRAAGRSADADAWTQKAIAKMSRLEADDRAVIERLMSAAAARLPSGKTA
jgi:hypothetical protein